VVSVDGNDMSELVRVLEARPAAEGQPTLVLANTVKGKGVSFAENVPSWHHHVPSDAELELALGELASARDAIWREGQGV
jgi:transketolase